MIFNVVKVHAHFKVERGATMGSLEQLMGSQTVGSTAKSVDMMRAFGLYSLVLIPIWAFSSLGSQVSFRGVYLTLELATGVRNNSRTTAWVTKTINLRTRFPILVAVLTTCGAIFIRRRSVCS